MNTLAIIPARGGSKRIPRKNIRSFCGKPIITYSIETALNSDFFDEVMVSTDDDEIANLAINMGAKVPFLRSDENSNDLASTADVILEVLAEYERLQISFDMVCCLYPTAPLIKQQDLLEGFKKLKKEGLTSVLPVVEFSYPIWRGLRINKDANVEMIWSEYLDSRSQDLEKAYHDAGQWYWLNVEKFKKEQALFSSNSGCIVLPETGVQDIDTEMDWILAEAKFKINNETI